MGAKWEYVPNDKEELKSIEVLINENGMNGLLVQYNGIHVDRLHEFPDLSKSARYFFTKSFYNNTDERITYTDNHGIKVDSTNPNAIFFSFETTNQDEIIDMIKYLASCCLNQDIDVNMTAHLGSNDFTIVSVKDNIEYIGLGADTKGISNDQIEQLKEMLNNKSLEHKL